MRRTGTCLVGVLLAMALAATAAPAKKASDTFPQTIALPNGFQPEGIASSGSRLFVGSIPTGAIWAGDARTGVGEVLVPAQTGRSAIGVKVDNRDRIFVAGGATGKAFVYDAEDGSNIASYQLAPPGAQTFVNDLVVTKRAVYLTDSRIQQLYVLPLGRAGELPTQSQVQTLPLTGDIVYTTGNNANGIVATPDGKRLIVVQGNVGKLFLVDPGTGVARQIDLGGANVENGDGLLLNGRTLYVVQNRRNQIAVITLSADLTSGRVTALLTDPDFDVPTTLTSAAGRLWAVNARFGTAPGPDVPYRIVQVD
jgi:sugar lactone lactonase YvrE